MDSCPTGSSTCLGTRRHFLPQARNSWCLSRVWGGWGIYSQLGWRPEWPPLHPVWSRQWLLYICKSGRRWFLFEQSGFPTGHLFDAYPFTMPAKVKISFSTLLFGTCVGYYQDHISFTTPKLDTEVDFYYDISFCFLIQDGRIDKLIHIDPRHLDLPAFDHSASG